MKNKTRGFEVASGWIVEDENMPKRATKCAAGYDICCVEDTVIESLWSKVFTAIRLGNFIQPIKPSLVHTGIKAYMGEDEVLNIYNRSGNPGKFGMILANSVGVIDSDYYSNKDNDGEIMFAFYNIFPVNLKLKKGDRLGQAVFGKFLKADNDSSGGVREGGFGSTGN